MFQHIRLSSLDEYFSALQSRKGNKVFFYRFTACNNTVKTFLKKYFEQARRSGVVIDGKIPNADQNNLSYYYEMMGDSFSLNKQFILQSLKKWLPRMNSVQLESVGSAIFDTLSELSAQGKNENMLKNAYIKFMCWLYYRFERITSRLGNQEVPKILYCGTISNYELLLISVLSKSGCDVVLIEPKGDNEYMRLDPESKLSDIYKTEGGTPFSPDFTLKQLQEESAAEANLQRVLGPAPIYSVSQNTWSKGKGLSDALTDVSTRGNEQGKIYTVFYRLNGVEDKVDYVNELISFRAALKNQQRNLVVINGNIEQPSMEEISAIKRGNYNNIENAVIDLSKNINFGQDINLSSMMKYEFIRLMLDESKAADMNVTKLVNTAVYVLCWLKRWQMKLFSGWKPEHTACFVLFGVCRNENESIFVRLLSRLPADVLILNTVISRKCVLKDNALREFNYDFTLENVVFPDEGVIVRAGTVAYHAERELDTLMYQDTGIYRNHQYSKATAIVLETMFEEIEILWDQELKFRPNFSTDNNEVKIPVIFSKISGVKDRNAKAYWSYIKGLITPDTVVLDGKKRAPFKTQSVNYNRPNPIMQYAAQFFRNGTVLKNVIKQHQCYQYGILRTEMQDYILDKLQTLIDSRIIKGTFENGTEYAIIAAVLNMDKELVRKLQNFDFTKKNPKVIYINTTETEITFDDAVVLEFLSLAGFDVLFCIPTGYNNVENYYAYPIISEHQAGDYLYDLKMPDFSHISANSRRSWRDKLFRRGV